MNILPVIALLLGGTLWASTSRGQHHDTLQVEQTTVHTESNFWKGALHGAVVGGVLAVGMGMAGGDDHRFQDEPQVYLPLFMLAGGIAGGLLGRTADPLPNPSGGMDSTAYRGRYK